MNTLNITTRTRRLGATIVSSNECRFRVWAPNRQIVDVHLVESGRIHPLEKHAEGYFSGALRDVPAGASYLYRLDQSIERPDPASRLQREGVHGPSQVVDPAYAWNDVGWRGVPLSRYVIYELHVGTFTRAGTFDAIVSELERLRDLGITAIELMPVAQFPGTRNWGYDGVFPYAVQDSYGGPRELQRLVDECHRAGLAVVLDVVYNHLGPEGNYLAEFAPYFTDAYQTP